MFHHIPYDRFQGDTHLVSQLPTTPHIQRAYKIARLAHRGQMRQSGECYLNHALRVALRLLNFGEDAICAGLLHDVVEDSAFTPDDLESLGFPAGVVEAVVAVTKQEGEPYEDLISRAAADPLGRLVKLADNLDNSANTQLTCFPPAKRARQQRKYLPARVALRAAIPTSERALLAA